MTENKLLSFPVFDFELMKKVRSSAHLNTSKLSEIAGLTSEDLEKIGLLKDELEIAELSSGDGSSTMTVRMSKKTNALLEELMVGIHSKVGVISRALAIMKFIKDAEDRGGKILVEEKNGDIKEIHFF
ncbi:hypothetical protein [uncultured Roseibium sp.]|uniref:hypothetical protein n=1 Tax=uncultured Roseibium sp. TaxID=1936171 RepID=UPI0032178305